jgi:hypothetical protein
MVSRLVRDWSEITRSTARNANVRSVSLPRSNADRIAWERTSSRNRITVAASVKLCAGGKFCSSKSCATLMASTIMRSELMRGTQGFWRSSYVRIAEPSARSSAILYARRSRTGRWPRPGSTSRMARLAARHTILDVIGCLLTNRCQVEKLLFYGLVFSRFGKLPIFGRFVPQIIGPIHVAPSFHTRRRGRPFYDRLRPLIAIRKPRPPELFACGGPTRKHPLFSRWGNDKKMRCPRRQRKRISTMLGVQPCQPRVLELSGISLVSL